MDKPANNQKNASPSVPFSPRKERFCLSGSTLKLIAIVTMLIDHIGAVLLEQGLLPYVYPAVLAGQSLDYLPADYLFWSHVDTALRLIGRLAFPIFCFLLVEGFFHTRSVARYAGRLALFCLLSEIPFDLACAGCCFDFSYQNVFFTLLIGLLVMAGCDAVSKWQSRQIINQKSGSCPQQSPASSRQFFTNPQFLQITSWLCRIAIIAAGMFAAEFLHTDYSSIGVFMISLLYLLHGDRKRQCIAGAIGFVWELTAPLAFIPVYFYNGERGNIRLKYFFYLFYPLHLLLLAILRTLLFT